MHKFLTSIIIEYENFFVWNQIIEIVYQWNIMSIYSGSKLI